MIGKKLLELILDEVKLPPEKQQEVIEDIDEAVRSGRLIVLYEKDKVKGFFTYFVRNKEIFINNCLVFKEFRKHTNLLSLRKTFREVFKDCRFSWESLKKQRMVSVK